jgi:hypothetical protein
MPCRARLLTCTSADIPAGFGWLESGGGLPVPETTLSRQDCRRSDFEVDGRPGWVNL